MLLSGVSNNESLPALGTGSENALEGVTTGAGRKMDAWLKFRLIVGGSMRDDVL